MLRLVLFDLDGTLIDSAPDLVEAAQKMLRDRGLAQAPYERVRRTVSSGGRGILAETFHITPADSCYPAMIAEFLGNYAKAPAAKSHLFEGIDALLGQLEARGIAWGIVTNKPLRFTEPVTAALGLRSRAAVIVSGDTAARAKPHPEPVLYALAKCSVSPSEALFVGDDERDIQAGHSAGLRAIAAGYGYLGTGADIHAWQADAIAMTPQELAEIILSDN